MVEGREPGRLARLHLSRAEAHRTAGLRIGIRIGVGIGGLGLAALALGHAERSHGTRRVELPEVILVGDPEELAVFRPDGASPGARIGRMVVFFVPEGDTELRGEFLELAGGQGKEVPVVLFRMESGCIGSVGRDGHVAVRCILQDQLALAVFERQLIDIVVSSIAPAALYTVRLVGGHDHPFLLVLIADTDVLDVLVGQLHESAAVEIDLGQIGTALFAPQVVLLHGLDVFVVPDPDVQLGLLEVHQRGVFLARDGAGAEGHEAVVELGAAGVTQFPSFRQFSAVVCHGLDGLRAVIEIQVERLLGIFGRVERAEESQAVGLFAEREGLEGRGFLTGDHFGRGFGGRIIDEDAAHVYAVLLVGLGDVSDLVAFFRYDVRLHALDGVDGVRIDIEDVQVVLGRLRSRFFGLLGLFGLLRLFAGLCRSLLLFRVGLRGGFLRFLEGHETGQFVAGLESLDHRELVDLAAGQVEDADAVLGHFVGFLLVDLRLAGLLELRRDAIDEFLAVFRNPGAGCALQVIGLAGLHVVEMEYQVSLLRGDGPAGPVTVVLDGESAHALPVVIHGVVEWRLGRKSAERHQQRRS